MLDQVVCVAAVTLLGVLEQGSGCAMGSNPEGLLPYTCSSYFSLQVIYARRKYSVSPPSTSGCPEFDRVFRAQANCSEYFPIFLTVLWVSGVFLSQVVAALLGLLYLYGRYQYFIGYSKSAHGRLGPLYFTAKVLWAMIGLSALGVLNTVGQLYLGMDFLQLLTGLFF